MIPLRLTVKNFMCYRDDVPTLVLEGIDLACLCGDNGHGKTALLDAITWALWGQARARTQDELVHQGQRDMAVELEFLARGQRYRASRRYSRSRRGRQGHTLLDLQALSNGVAHGIASGVMQTEPRIKELLNMDYDTFVNTAYLRQDDAGRFTTSKPAERKQRLAEVLDLSYYQRLEERAKARSRTLRLEIQRLEGTIDTLQRQVAERPEHERELASVKTDSARIALDATAHREKAEELRRSVDSLHRRRDELQELSRRLADAEGDVAVLERQMRTHEDRVKEYQSALQRETEIRERFAALEKSKASLNRLNEALARKSKLDAVKARLEREVAVQRERLSGRLTQLRGRISGELEPRAQRLPEIEEGLRSIARERVKLDQLDETMRGRREEAADTAARARDLKLANDRLRQQMEDARKKFDMLEQGDSTCPLCKQPLGEEGQTHLRREYEAQGLERKEQYQENASEQKALERAHKEMSARLSQLDRERDRERRLIEGRVAVLEREKADSIAARAELEPTRADLKQLESRLTTDDFANEERGRLAKLDEELSALGYDAEAHRDAQTQVTTLEAYDNLHRKLQEAAERLPNERETLSTARQMLDRRGHEVAQARERMGTLEVDIKALPSLESQLKEAEERHRDLETRREAALLRQGVLEQQIKRCNALEAELGERQEQRRNLLDERGIYDELALAFGKNGVQALIIETAIPQLQSDANQILGRLTENRMFLKLQLDKGRRDSRTGLQSEELDIKIGDEVGTRSYETFSGGEAFRINFALRIALSKLLARRSGAPLPILFIDEGFGSQDREGQERLTEAIQSVQGDFDKIIVITHIEQIKEAFPVRIEVTKTGSGSTFEVA